MELDATIARMPKAELHLHLEGTISAETLWAIAQRNQVALPVGTLAELKALYAFEGFDKFLNLWLAMCRCLRADADYELMVDAFAEDCRRQNIRYVEAHFTPYNHERFGFGARRALDIVTRRIEAAERDGGPVIRLITDIPSESVPESGPFTVRLLEEEAHPLIVAIGLGGPEEGFPRRLVEEHFRKERMISFYAEKLAITADRLNDHVKRVSGVTAGHLIRQRVLTEAKRALVFTGQPIHEVSYDLGFTDPSHFARFFRKQTGTTPQEFREGRGG